MLKGRRFSPAMIVAMIALAVALSGTAVAGTTKLITGSQIANGTIKLADITRAPRRRSRARPARQARRAMWVRMGAQGPIGPQGAKGDEGSSKGESAGVSGYEVRTWRYSTDDANSDIGSGVRRRRLAARSPRSPARPARSRLAAATGSSRRVTTGSTRRQSTTEAASSRPSRSHGLEHGYGQAERQLWLDRAGQRQGERRRHDAVRHLRERQVATPASAGCSHFAVGT